MNPKGEEGEFYMKKSLLVLASIMILALCTFVACTAEVSDPYDGLTYVTFGGESSTSKNLFASYEVASYDSLYWFYTAEKKDNYGTSGAVENKPVHEGNTGLNNTVGPFSQGKWLFTLCAYKNNAVSEDAKVYEGSVEVSLKGQNVTVPVSVTPYGETGALEFRGAYFAWKNNSETSTAVPTIMIVAKGTTNGYEYDLSNSFTEIKGENTKKMEIPLVITGKDSEGKFYINDTEAKFGSVVADYYTSTIIAYIDDPNTPIFSQTLGFRVYGSATTVICGDITEQSGTDVNFDPAKQDMAVFKGATTASVKVTPSGTDTTTVDFGANNLDNTSTYYLNVSATSAASAANKFTVSDSTKAPVAGIDIELVKVALDGDNTNVTEFKGDIVTITTYIEKGLTGVKVYHNGAVCDDNPTYDPEDGKLVFTTNHFSEFYAVSDSVAVVSNETTEKGYARLVDAFDNSVDGCSIKLLKDIEMSSMVRITRRIRVDLNGFAITTSSDFPKGAGIFTVREGGFLTIDDSSTKKTGLIENSKKDGDANSVERYGIVVYPYKSSDGKALNDSGYAKLIVNGGTIKASYAAISGNGSFGSGTSTDIVVKDGVLEGGVTAVYHPQNGNIIVEGGSFKGNDSAIEIRAGRMTIDGGTFTANATKYSCTANGNGTTTIGASIAVAQHNTKLPIDVVINGASILTGVYDLSVTNPQGNSKDAISEVKVTINKETENLYVSTDFIREGNVIRAKTTEEDSKYVACLSDGFNFTSLKDAVDAVTDSGYITLLQDVEDGDGILIPVGNRSITVDFNDKLYVVTKNFAEKKYQENRAFKLGKGNAVTFKNGRISSTSKWAVLIENFANLTLYDIVLDGSEIFATSSLLCKYGITQIGGLTKIINTENGSYNNTAISVNYLPDDTNYNEGELSVSFTGDYCGEVVGSIYFQSKLVRPVDIVDYTHSLKIDSKLGSSFEKANLVLQNIRSKSFFKMKENLISKEKINTSIKLVDDGEGFKVFDQDSKGILNKTIDMFYTDDLRQAVFNAEDGDELVLLKDCVLTGYPVEINSRKITIDLNGKGIKAGPNFNGTDGMIKVDSGILIVNDSSSNDVAGSIDATSKNSVKYAIQAVRKATVEINGGIIKGSISAIVKNADSSSTPKNNSTIRITGGTFNSDPTLYVNTETHDISPDTNTGTWTVTAKN